MHISGLDPFTDAGGSSWVIIRSLIARAAKMLAAALLQANDRINDVVDHSVGLEAF